MSNSTNHKLKFDVHRWNGIVHTLHIFNSFKCLELVVNFEQVLRSKVWYFQPINRGNSNVKKYTFFLEFRSRKKLYFVF